LTFFSWFSTHCKWSIQKNIIREALQKDFPMLSRNQIDTLIADVKQYESIILEKLQVKHVFDKVTPDEEKGSPGTVNQRLTVNSSVNADPGALSKSGQATLLSQNQALTSQKANLEKTVISQA
jgi:hypothetical protein